MAVGGEALVPVEVLAPAVGGGPERQTHADVRATEDPGVRMLQELVEDAAGVRIGQREGGAQVVQQGAGDCSCL